MKHHRQWISLIGFCLATVVAIAIGLAIVIAGASVALASHQNDQNEQSQSDSPQTAAATTVTPTPAQSGTLFTGMITDSHCGARHMRNSHMNSTECVRACYRKGASYVLIDGEKRYVLIGGDGQVSKLAGERANVTGTRQGDSILVDSAASIF